MPLMGVKELRLNVTGAGDGIAYDHADWADAKLECGPVVPPPAPGPVVVPPAPGISTVSGLVDAATRAKPGDTLTLATGTFELLQALKIPSGVGLRGAGAGKTIITNASSFSPGNAGLDNDEGASVNAVDCSKYLINLGRDTAGFSVTELTLTGTNIPGGICGIALKNVTLSKLEFKSFLWAGARLFVVENLKATDNTFFDEEFENRFGTRLRSDAFEHLPTAATGFCGSGFHPVGAALGLDHLQTLGPWLGRLQQCACE